jgi:hypothetical protein
MNVKRGRYHPCPEGRAERMLARTLRSSLSKFKLEISIKLRISM